MLIEELTRQESLDLLARTRLGRLACTQGNQPETATGHRASPETAAPAATRGRRRS